jgi:signal recognition particle receptor subunit beta
MDEFPENADVEILNDALEKLGKHFLFSRGKVIDSARDTLRDIDVHIDTLKNDKASLQRDKEFMTGKIANLDADIRKKEAMVVGLHKKFLDLRHDKEEIERNFSLVSDALSANAVESESIRTFCSLVEKDFREFCDHEKAVNDAAAYQQFQQIIAEMQLFANCPDLRSKTVGAIGGGFSSGKSAFINSLFSGKADIKLAEGIRPVTAIPSYVLCGSQARIEGVNYNGGAFGIPVDVYKEISHELLSSFSFDLKKIIPYIIVHAPLPEDRFGDLCLIDTPGYNPSAANFTGTDLETAREYIRDKEARFLIWMVGLDANGTIPQSDLEFLNELEFGKSEDHPLYVIASKAELKPAGDIEDILDTFEDCLNDADLQYAGISAYSSRNRKIYAARGQDLFEFLSKNNAPREHHSHLTDILRSALRPYVEEIYQDDHQKNQDRNSIRALLLEALKAGVTDVVGSENRLEEGLLALEKRITHAESLEVRLNRLRELCDKFFRCLDDFCAEVDMEKADVSARMKALFDKPVLEMPKVVIGDVEETDTSRPNPKEKFAKPVKSKQKSPSQSKKGSLFYPFSWWPPFPG